MHSTLIKRSHAWVSLPVFLYAFACRRRVIWLSVPAELAQTGTSEVACALRVMQLAGRGLQSGLVPKSYVVSFKSLRRSLKGQCQDFKISLEISANLIMCIFP
mmetsp:Transcript_47630/g.126305  ORF Transcript_47630/g.126305 Transcript_47630/m.126305 type:complete len:103 (-) Transcript_47630:680-988(-)